MDDEEEFFRQGLAQYQVQEPKPRAAAAAGSGAGYGSGSRTGGSAAGAYASSASVAASSHGYQAAAAAGGGYGAVGGKGGGGGTRGQGQSPYGDEYGQGATGAGRFGGGGTGSGARPGGSRGGGAGTASASAAGPEDFPPPSRRAPVQVASGGSNRGAGGSGQKASQKAEKHSLFPMSKTRAGTKAKGSGKKKSKGAKSGGKGGERGDDSEEDIEVLDISSDEEEKKKAAKAPKVRIERAKQLRHSIILEPRKKEEEDPGKWDDVSADLLLRKVKDLRNVKKSSVVALSMAQSGDDTSAAVDADGAGGEKGGMAVENGVLTIFDPLGLGPLDISKLCLASRVATAADLPEGAEHAGRIVNVEETFDPLFYLTRVHESTTLAELERGKFHLEKDLRTRQRQAMVLVKENFDAFISCKAMALDVQRGLNSMRRDMAVDNLGSALQSLASVANTAFGSLLIRQEEVDRIRSVQGVLSRFRTLFNMPAVIGGFVERKEYDSAVHEYRKAVSLGGTFNVRSQLLKRVMEKVDGVVDEFAGEMYRQLADSGSSQSQIETAIRVLLEIDPEADPVWHYLTAQDQRIRGLLQACVVEHERRVSSLQKRHREKRSEEARWRSLQAESNTRMSQDVASILLQSDVDADGISHDADDISRAEDEELNRRIDDLHVALIRRLSAVLKQHVPSFWTLALSVFSGKFVGPSATIAATGGGGGGGGRDGLQQNSQKQNEIEAIRMVLGIIHVYETQVRNSLASLEHSSGSSLQPLLSTAISEVSSTVLLLAANNNAPPQAAAALFNLRIEVTAQFVRHLCFVMRSAAAELADEEDWVPAPTVEIGSSPFDISSFPLRFRDRMKQCLDEVTEALTQIANERQSGQQQQQAGGAGGGGGGGMGSVPPQYPVESIRAMHDSVKTTFYESFLDYAECLSRLAAAIPLSLTPAAGDPEDDPNMEGEEDQAADDDALPGVVFSGLRAGVEVSSPEQRVLMLLSNAGFGRSSVAPQLAQAYRHLWGDPSAASPSDSSNRRMPAGYQQPQLNEAERLLADIEEPFLKLETELGDQYIAMKAGHLGSVVIRYFLEDGTAWAAAPPVKGLRDSALDLILPLVAVHAEAYAGCSTFVEKAITTLAEGLVDALRQVAEKHPDLQVLDPNAFCQLSLELDYFSTVLRPFATAALDDIILELREMLLRRAMEHLDFSAVAAEERQPRRMLREDGEEDIPTPQTPDDLINTANMLSQRLLPHELRRTKINILCFGGRLLEDPPATPPGQPAPYGGFNAPPSPSMASSSSQNSGISNPYSAVYAVPDVDNQGLAARAQRDIGPPPSRVGGARGAYKGNSGGGAPFSSEGGYEQTFQDGAVQEGIRQPPGYGAKPREDLSRGGRSTRNRQWG